MPLDLPGAPSEPSPPDPARRDPAERKSRTVAVIDDDAAVCDSTRILLEIYDFAVRTYQSAAAFMQESPAVSCIVVDYHMPGMNGLDLVSRLRSRGNSVPVIMITATSEAKIEKLAAQLGIRRVLQKPLGKALVSSLQEELGEG